MRKVLRAKYDEAFLKKWAEFGGETMCTGCGHGAWISDGKGGMRCSNCGATR